MELPIYLYLCLRWNRIVGCFGTWFVGYICSHVPVIQCISYAVYEDIVARDGAAYQDKIDEIGIEVEEITDFDDV